jgi:hypothetical protein
VLYHLSHALSPIFSCINSTLLSTEHVHEEPFLISPLSAAHIKRIKGQNVGELGQGVFMYSHADVGSYGLAADEFSFQ